MGYDFELEEQVLIVHPAGLKGGAERASRLALSIDGIQAEVALTPGQNRGEFTLEVDGQSEQVFAATDGDSHFIHLRGRTHRVEAINALDRARQDAAPAGGDEALCAPMPGVVVEVAVELGAEVEAGQLLLTIESMKLQTAIIAPASGRVVELDLQAGTSFVQGAVLVRIESDPDNNGTDVHTKEESR